MKWRSAIWIIQKTPSCVKPVNGRIARTIVYLAEADAAAFEGRETAEITIKFPTMEKTFTGQSLATEFTLANFFFHVTTPLCAVADEGRPDRERWIAWRVLKP